MAENDTILNCVELYSNKLCQANKRANQNDCDTERRREKDRCSTASVRAQSKSVDKVIQEFLAKVKFGPDYVCTCCHRMLYRHAVIGFKPTKYTKASPELRRELSEHASDGKQQRRMHMLFLASID